VVAAQHSQSRDHPWYLPIIHPMFTEVAASPDRSGTGPRSGKVVTNASGGAFGAG